MKQYQHRAFSGYGVEIEYMIVDAQTLNVVPIADQLLDLVGGAEDMDVDRGEAAWSNELALHVIEVKTNGPCADLSAGRRVFVRQVEEINGLLAPLGACLMPGGMHPWMDPLKETRLWPHQNQLIYNTFDRIFGCRGHGWSNLQSTHINFPFSTPEEFEALHAACRFVLPLIPALAASSPYFSGRRGPGLSTRLLVYRKNCSRVPSVAGVVVPERVYTEEGYQALLEGIYKDLKPYDPQGILAEEWVNARGCIARFDRGAIEIRLIDAQESPGQDLSVVAFVTSLVQALFEGSVCALEELKKWDEKPLSELLLSTAVQGRATPATEGYAAAWGSKQNTMGGLVKELAHRFKVGSGFSAGVDLIIEEGPLAERLVRAAGAEPSFEVLENTYRQLCSCLAEDRPFEVSAS